MSQMMLQLVNKRTIAKQRKGVRETLVSLCEAKGKVLGYSSREARLVSRVTTVGFLI